MALPNFLIIGAAKAGTTSLWHYLGQHPEIFMSAVKEPNYFITLDRDAYQSIRVTKNSKQVVVATLEEYERLFDGSEGYKATGEASPNYIFYPKMAEVIDSLLPTVRLICILRDPCMRAFSQYNFLRLLGKESETSFLEAIKADQQRPKYEKYHYIERGLYYKQIARFYDIFSRSRLLVLFNEDLKTDPCGVLTRVYDYLEVDRDVKINTGEKLIVSGRPRSRSLHWLLTARNPINRFVRPVTPNWIRNAARRIKNVNLERNTLSHEDRAAIKKYFVEDIDSLEALLNITLDSWTFPDSGS